MAGIVYGSPYRPPAPAAPAFSGFELRWEAKGSSWPLTDPKTGLFLMPGVRGLGSAAHERHSTSSPAAPGSRFEGVSVLDREAFWPLYIYHDGGSVDWMQRDRAFWSTMDPLVPGVWVITLPDGSERSLPLRFVDDGDPVTNHDPMRRGWNKYGIKLVAEQPYWTGEPVVRSWKNRDTAPFFEPTGPQIVNIAAGSDTSTAAIDNPGDVESYATWFVDGPTPSASVGIGDQIVDVPFAVDDGKCLVIDSDPDLIGATLYDISPAQLGLPADKRKKPADRIVGVDLVNPVDMTADLGEADFAPIPAGKSVQLAVVLAGTGAVEIKLPTLYRRAW